MIKDLLLKLVRKTDPAYNTVKNSWAQQGEDVLIDFYFKWVLEKPNPSYLDIGAHHPYYLSNTYLFYEKGCRGVTIEPDSTLFSFIQRKRPGDVHLNVGVGPHPGYIDFYIMTSPTLNTFSQNEAERIVAQYNSTVQIKDVKKVEVLSVNNILDTYFSSNNNYFISIDVEGWDIEILYSIDFIRHRPELICIELNGQNGDDVSKFMKQRGYQLYSFNNTNSIYIIA